MEETKNVSRRNFLSNGAKTAAAGVALSAVRYKNVLGANNRITMAVIGIRGRGLRRIPHRTDSLSTVLLPATIPTAQNAAPPMSPGIIDASPQNPV